MEGIMHSLLLYGWNFKQQLVKGETVETTDQQKENMRRLIGDVIIIGLAILAYSTIPDDDDETKLDDDAATVLQRALQDLLVVYNLFDYAEMLTTPIAISFTYRTIQQIWNMLIGIPDPNKPTLEQIWEVPPITRHLDEFTKYMENE